MRLRRISTIAAGAAAAALVLSACAPPEDAGTDGATGDATEPASTVSQSIAVTVGPNDFISYNGFTPETYSTYNSAIADRLLAGFYYYDNEGVIQTNEDLVSYELVSEDPMVVEYTINDDAQWSDGTPITVADAILAWGTQNPNLATDGEPLFNSVSVDLGDEVPDGPQGDIDGKTFTVEFVAPNPDWEILTWINTPAHVVAEQGGLTTEELAQAILDGDSEALQVAADFWNTGWNTDPGTLPDEALIPSSGPYVLSSWEAGQSVTLAKNENYYGTPAANDELVVRFVAQDAMVQALDNGDVDVIAPQPTVDTVAQIEGLGDAAQLITGPTLTWEHLDFNFVEGNEMGASLELRQAFAHCVPRQQIVDNLIAPVFDEAEVMNAREVFNFEDDYQEVVDAAYDGRYDEVDIEAATALVESSGASNLDVRIGYSAPNPRRTDQVALIKASCDQAGFNVIDAGNEDFFIPGGTQERGDYDVALFAWSGSGQVASGQNTMATGLPQNYGEYSNAEMDEAWATLVSTLDESVHLEQTKVIEQVAWDTLFNIPVFAHPGVDAAASDIENVLHNVTQTGIIWNVEQFARSE